MRNGGNTQKNGHGGNLGFEAEMFKAANKLRGNMEPSHYRYVALDLIFSKYSLDAFETKRTARLADDDAGDKGCERVTPQASCALRPPPCEDKDECLADNVFWVPKAALLPKLLLGELSVQSSEALDA